MQTTTGSVKQWISRLHSFPGKETERDIYVKPPAEAKKEGIIWRLNKVAYGLCHAKELCKLECKQSQLDKALFRWYVNVEGVFVMHVDCFLYAWTENFKKIVITKIQRKLKVGKHMEGNFRYVGLDITQTEEGVIAEQNNKISSIQPIPISLKCKSEKYAELNQEDIGELRAVIGQLNWLSACTIPDISFNVLELSTAIKHPLVEDLTRANKLVHMLKADASRILFPVLSAVEELQIDVYCDASWGNLGDGSSAEGYVILLSGPNKQCCPIFWSNNKIFRKVQSTLSAETLSAYDAVDEAIYIGHMLTELYYDDYFQNKIPVIVYTDNQSLHDNIHSTKQVKEKRLRITLTGIQESLKGGDIKKIMWISNKCQSADCLTKKGASHKRLMYCLNYGLYS